MKSVLISIRPQWCEKIASGKKTIEVRKSAPKEVPFKGYIYATRPKKYYKCGAVITSDELLWLANGEVEMGDGFKFWADGDEYQCLNGRIIGEFICNRIDVFSPSEHGIRFKRFRALYETCLTVGEMRKYANGKPLYGLHISDLKIYDKPKELSEFRACNFKSMNGTDVCGNYDCKYYQDSGSYMIPPSCAKNGCRVTRPPQNYIYVEEQENSNE